MPGGRPPRPRSRCSAPEGCDRVVQAKGLCSMHYQRMGSKWSTPYQGNPYSGAGPSRCSVDGCEEEVFGHGLCNLHWQRWRAHGDPTVTKYSPQPSKTCVWCGKSPTVARGLCRNHYNQLWKQSRR